MIVKRLLLAAFGIALLLPLSGCGCHRRCCGDDTRSQAPPPGCCNPPRAPGYVPPAGYVPNY
jgi:hypothetical protein